MSIDVYKRQQLESALSELKTVDNLRPFVELNPYRDVLAQATQFVGYLPNVDDVTPVSYTHLCQIFYIITYSQYNLIGNKSLIN